MLEGILHDHIFKSMYNIIHIDGKWFYMNKKSENCYLLRVEGGPRRLCKKQKFYCQSYVFLLLLLDQDFDSQGNEIFSDKFSFFFHLLSRNLLKGLTEL